MWGGFCAWTVHLYGGEWTAMLLMLCTAGAAGGVTTSQSPSLPVAIGCVVLLIAPTIVAAAALGGPRFLSLAGLITFDLAFLLMQAKRNWQVFWETSVLAEREKARGSHDRQRARRERETLVSAIEQSAEEILITDAAGEIRYCNLSFQKLSGFGKEEVAGRPLRFLSASGTEDKEERALAEAIGTGGTWSGRLSNRTREGKVYHVEGTISPIAELPGRLSGFVWAARDVTERLRLEDELRHAQKMESIGRLAGGVAHDFNNLLTVIKGYAGLLEEYLKNDRRGQYASLITKASDQAAALTKQLLTFSRKQLIRPKMLNLNVRVGELTGMLQRMMGEDIEVRAELEPELGWIRADSDQITQILLNLAANARDAMPHGGVLVMSTSNGQAPGTGEFKGAAVTLSVKDTGTGITEEVRQHLFEPFFTTKERGKGTGLGLSTVYGIVQQNGGRIDVTSEPGLGSTFTIHFPRVDAGATPRASESGMSAAGAGSPGQETD
jgi:PAS domain S-box-containing protein